ncbi:MAG: FeoB small GTPase domain-containing protein, partial [Dysgonomonas sp.]
MNLSDLKTGEKGVIVKVNGSGAFRKRILEMGFVKGKVVKVILNAPLKDPIKYKIMDYEVSLRRSEARLIDVVYPDNRKEKKDEIRTNEHYDFNQNYSASDSLKKISNGEKKITIALVGNPNAGKTSLFNIASGSHEHVGNYGGVTVDSKEGYFKHDGYQFKIVDLPGTYSISAYSPEELYVRKSLIEEKPDIVINVVAASNLERNLYLTTELIDLDVPMVIALNMYDELLASGNEFDYKGLAKLLGIPIAPTVGRTGKGIPELFDTVINVYEGKEAIVKKIKIYYGYQLENAISRMNILLEKEKVADILYPTRYLSIKILEKDQDVANYIKKTFPSAAAILAKADQEIKDLE